jgi:hypothetical protein
MTVSRGREGRLKSQHASLYPGLTPGVWMPVETLIRHVTDLIQQDPSRSRTITGPRLLHQDHFDYRGSSSRPEGLPPGLTRMSDAGLDPGPSGPPGSRLDRNSSKPRETTE